MALYFLGLAGWLAVAGFGGWLLVTGRSLFLGLPLGINDARLRRLFGLFCVLVGGFFVFQGPHRLDSVIGLYGSLGFVALAAWWKARNGRATGGER